MSDFPKKGKLYYFYSEEEMTFVLNLFNMNFSFLPFIMQISCNFLSGDEAATPPLSQDASPSTVVKRRPGRPRLRPVGPAHQGGRQPKSLSADGAASSGKRGGRRGAPPGPRVIKPLPVPIGSMTTNKQAGEGVRASSSPFVPSTSAASTNPRPPGPSIYGPMSP